jgi:hypothetical protein
MSLLQTPQSTINPQKRLSAESAQRILAELPAWVVAAIADRAAAIEYPVEAVVEMAFMQCLWKRIASFLG